MAATTPPTARSGAPATKTRATAAGGTRTAGTSRPPPTPNQAGRGAGPGWDFDPVANDNQGWERVETEFIRSVVRSLHWLGLCDVGLDEGAGAAVVAFRMNELGRHVLDPRSKKRGGAASRGAAASDTAADVAHGARVVVQPNFHIMAIGPVPVANLMRLERFADRVGTDRVLEYALTRASVYRGQQDGLSGGQIVAALAELSGADVPQNVARSIDEWQQLHETIVVHRRAVLVQAADGALMERVGAADGGGGSGFAVVADPPTLARVVDPARLDATFTHLGLAPATRHDPSAAGSVRIADDSTVQPVHKVISIYLLGQLQRLAEWEAVLNTWRVTAAAAVRAKRELGLDAPAQLAQWSTLCAGGPPEWLDRRLKAWCGHYGSAKVHRPVLIELPNEASLGDLMADPRGAALARRFKPRGPVVEVDEGDVEAGGRGVEGVGIEGRGKDGGH